MALQLQLMTSWRYLNRVEVFQCFSHFQQRQLSSVRKRHVVKHLQKRFYHVTFLNQVGIPTLLCEPQPEANLQEPA